MRAGLDPFEQNGDTLTDADAHGAKGVATTATMQLVNGSNSQACTAGTQRVAQSNGATVRVDAWVIVLKAQLAQYGQALCGEGLVQLDDVNLSERDAGVGQQRLRGRGGADPHDAGSHSGGCHADHACPGGQTVLSGGGFVGQHQGAGAVVHATGVPSGNRTVGAHHTAQLGQCFQRGVARVFVVLHHNRVTLALGDGYWNDLFGQ